MAVALITGASRGLGRALARTLAARNWALVLDARGAPDLDTVARELSGWTRVVALAGDVADPQHRAALAAAAVGLGTVDLLVNNASVLGPSPKPALADYPLDEFSRVYDVNVVAPLGLTQLLLQEDNGRSKRIPRRFLGAVPPCGRVHSGRSAGFGGPLNGHRMPASKMRST